MIKISVVVPVFNVEKYINACVTSLLEQDFESYEVIFVDDGSQDNSVKLIQDKISGRDNYKIVSKENGGLSSARNFGMKFVKGEFVTFLDSDDILDIDFLSKMAHAIGDANICCCGYTEIAEDGRKLKNVSNAFSKKNEHEIFKNVVESINFIPNAWGKLYRKSIFDKIHYPEGLLFEDYAIAYKVFFDEKVSFLDEPLYKYRIREGSIMRQFNENIVNHKFLILSELSEFLAEKKISDRFKNAYINSYLHHGLFVTSCIIINQRADNGKALLKKLVCKSDEKIFNLKNVISSKTLPFKAKIYLSALRISPSLAYHIKLFQNKLGK